MPGVQKTALWGSKNRIIVYAGQYFDAETGLHYNYHRYYDPSLGRYLRADPIGLDGGINLYAYVENNPLTAVDPIGLSRRDPNSQYCKSLLRRIRNLEKELEKRYREYAEDPLNLPERIGPGEGLHETRRGHRTKINETDSRLNKNLKKYRDECGPPPAPGTENTNDTCESDFNWEKIAPYAPLILAPPIIYQHGVRGRTTGGGAVVPMRPILQ